jgi:HPr kinase/phosphorylase
LRGKSGFHCLAGKAILTAMQVHGSCAARNGAGVLLLGPPGAGKSDLVLRLIDRGFMLVADDRVEILAGRAAAPEALAGLLEVRGLGILRLPFLASVPLALAVELCRAPARLPEPAQHPATGLPLIALDPFEVSAAQRLELALAWVRGEIGAVVGAFAIP